MSEELDQIQIHDLLVRCIVGLNPDERREKQDVIINLTLFTDLHAAGQSDRLEDSVDYRALKQRVISVVEASSDLLVERLAQRIADTCLEFDRVARVRVRLEKPGALRFARSVGVEILR